MAQKPLLCGHMIHKKLLVQYQPVDNALLHARACIKGVVLSISTNVYKVFIFYVFKE